MKGNRKQHLRDNTRSGDAFEQSVRLFGNLEFDRRETEGRLQFALVLLRIANGIDVHLRHPHLHAQQLADHVHRRLVRHLVQVEGLRLEHVR